MFFGFHCFGENTVCACCYIGFGALDSFFQPFLCKSVGAGHDKEVWIGACVDGRFDAIDHLFGRDDFFIGAVTTTLLGHLVFHVHGRSAGLFHIFNGFGDVKCAAPAGVDIY